MPFDVSFDDGRTNNGTEGSVQHHDAWIDEPQLRNEQVRPHRGKRLKDCEALEAFMEFQVSQNPLKKSLRPRRGIDNALPPHQTYINLHCAIFIIILAMASHAINVSQVVRRYFEPGDERSPAIDWRNIQPIIRGYYEAEGMTTPKPRDIQAAIRDLGGVSAKGDKGLVYQNIRYRYYQIIECESKVPACVARQKYDEKRRFKCPRCGYPQGIFEHMNLYQINEYIIAEKYGEAKRRKVNPEVSIFDISLEIHRFLTDGCTAGGLTGRCRRDFY